MTSLDKSNLDKLRQNEDLKLRNMLEENETLAQEVFNEMKNMQENKLVKTIINNLHNSNRVTRKTLELLSCQRSIGKTYTFHLDTGHVVRITVEEDINTIFYKGEQFLEDK